MLWAKESQLKIRARLKLKQGNVLLNRKQRKNPEGVISIGGKKDAIQWTCVWPEPLPSMLGLSM